jgi:hypothetical protein
VDHRGNELEAGYSDYTEISTPSGNPASGVLRFYSKSDDNLYKKNSAGVESRAGGSDLLSPLVNSEISITGTATGTISTMHVCSGTSSAYTVTLPAVSGNTGKLIGFRMSAALTQLVTIKGNASETIDGLNTRVMWSEEVAILYCNGVTWTKVAGKSNPMSVWMYLNGNSGTPTNITLTKILINATQFDNTGLMADIPNSRIIIARTGRYLVDSAVWVDPTGITMQRLLSEIYQNGSNITVIDAPQWTSAAYAVSQTPQFSLSLTAADIIELYGYIQYTGGSPVFNGGGNQRTRIAFVEIPSW